MKNPREEDCRVNGASFLQKTKRSPFFLFSCFVSIMTLGGCSVITSHLSDNNKTSVSSKLHDGHSHPAIVGDNNARYLTRDPGNFFSPPYFKPTGRSMRIALLLPFGSNSPLVKNVSQALYNAAQLAVMEQNDPNVLLMVGDTKGDSAEAARVAEKMIKQGADVIIGPLFSSDVQAVSKVTQPYGVPVVAFSTDRFAAQSGTYLLSFLPDDDVQRMLSYARSRGLTRIAALIPQTSYGTHMRDLFMKATSEYGITVTKVVEYPSGAPSIASSANGANVIVDQVSELAESYKNNPFQAIFIPDVGKSLKTVAPIIPYLGLGRDIKLLGTNLWAGEDLSSIPALVGAWFPSSPPGAYARFSADYQKAYNQLPSRISSLAYDALNLSITLSRYRSNSGPIPFSMFVHKKGFGGVDGLFRFLRGGLVQRALAVMEITKNGSKLIGQAPSQLVSSEVSAAGSNVSYSASTASSPSSHSMPRSMPSGNSIGNSMMSSNQQEREQQALPPRASFTPFSGPMMNEAMSGAASGEAGGKMPLNSSVPLHTYNPSNNPPSSSPVQRNIPHPYPFAQGSPGFGSEAMNGRENDLYSQRQHAQQQTQQQQQRHDADNVNSGEQLYRQFGQTNEKSAIGADATQYRHYSQDSFQQQQQQSQQQQQQQQPRHQMQQQYAPQAQQQGRDNLSPQLAQMNQYYRQTPRSQGQSQAQDYNAPLPITNKNSSLSKGPLPSSTFAPNVGFPNVNERDTNREKEAFSRGYHRSLPPVQSDAFGNGAVNQHLTQSHQMSREDQFAAPAPRRPIRSSVPQQPPIAPPLPPVAPPHPSAIPPVHVPSYHNNAVKPRQSSHNNADIIAARQKSVSPHYQPVAPPPSVRSAPPVASIPHTSQIHKKKPLVDSKKQVIAKNQNPYDGYSVPYRPHQ